MFSDRILKWSKKDGIYTSFQVTGGFLYNYLTSLILDQKSSSAGWRRDLTGQPDNQSLTIYMVGDLMFVARFLLGFGKNSSEIV